MSETERLNGRTARRSDQASRLSEYQPRSQTNPRDTSARVITQPISARAAAAQYDLAAILQLPPEPQLQPPPEASRERALVPPSMRVSTDLTTRPQVSDESGPMDKSETDGANAPGRLPSAWYKQAEEIAEASRKERMALAIRAAAAICLATGAALLFWLGAFGGRVMTETQAPMSSASVQVRRVPVATFAMPDKPATSAIEPNARALVTTAQILAVAERFIAEGDVRAARAMLTDTAATGDGRALFALAETYDPNLLASWNAQHIESSASYARLLYEAALKAGVADAQTRLDALN